MNSINPLTEEQIAAIQQKYRGERGAMFVRFMIDGRAACILSGRLEEKGINVIHQISYWYVVSGWVKEVREALEKNNPGRKVRIAAS